MLTYPSSLPRPQLSNLSFKQHPNLQRTQLDSGRTRVRARFQSVPTYMTATWLCKSEDARVFEGFVTHALKAASAWFLMDIKTPQGLVSHKVRFVSNPLENYQPISALWWEYKASIEIEKRNVDTEEQTADSLLSPKTTEQFINGIQAAVNSYQER